MTKTFTDRCHIAQQFLPDAQYKAMLTALHTEMLAKLAEQPAQQEPEWVGLTDDVLLELLTGVDEQAVRLPPGLRAFARAIEAKLRSKNHD